MPSTSDSTVTVEWQYGSAPGGSDKYEDADTIRVDGNSNLLVSRGNSTVLAAYPAGAWQKAVAENLPAKAALAIPTGRMEVSGVSPLA